MCNQLRAEYRTTCTVDKPEKVLNEFCGAYENVCFKIPRGEPDQSLVPASSTFGDADEYETSVNKYDNSKYATAVEPNMEETLPPLDRTDLWRTLPSPTSAPSRDYSEFCDEYKQRFLYVCPDPFRFGQRAAVFCPIYSERCKLPVPDRPIPPESKQRPVAGNANPVQQLCNQYRGFALVYCANPFIAQQPTIRDGCQKFWKFCTPWNPRYG